MDLQAFLMENAPMPQNKEVLVSKRFLVDGKPALFRLRAVSEGENVALRRACRVKSPDRPDGVLDRDRYLLKLAAASVVWPELKNTALQDSWGVRGEEELLSRMLTAGEFATLLAAVREICGFEEERLKEQLKK